MQQHLLATVADLSIEQFRPVCDVLLLGSDDSVDDLSAYKSVYIRSQFNDEKFMPQNFASQINKIGTLARNAGIKLIDNMGSVDEIIAFEDKWYQFQLFREFMPETKLASEQPGFGEPVIFKKRISSRAAGIAWLRSDIIGNLDDWICQPILDIQEELRVYVVRGMVVEVASIRQTKTMDQKIKVIGTRHLTSEERHFAEQVYKKRPSLDLVGIDIAVTSNGLRLIEVNRSPVFASFMRESGQNLAELLYRLDCK